MYLGPFFFDTKEIFLVIASLLLALALFLGWEIWWFDHKTLLTLVLLVLITKGLLPAIHNEAFFILALATIVLSLFFPLFHVVLFYFISFLIFRLMKVI